MKISYCSASSLEANEEMYGYGAVARTWILIEYPAPWGANAVRDSRFSSAVKENLAQITKLPNSNKILFIKKGREFEGEGIVVFVVYPQEKGAVSYKLKLESYDELLKFTMENIEARSFEFPSEIWGEKLYLVCTHGKHDKCCAKFGFTTFKKLQTLRGNEVWQSSHVGGDRFASNVVCFPEGIFYGRVNDRAAGEIIESFDADKLLLSRYRGRCCYSKEAQVGEYFTRRESGITEIAGFTLVELEKCGEDRWRATFLADAAAGARHSVEFHSYLSEFEYFTTCHAEKPSRTIQYKLDSYRVLESFDLKQT